MFPGYPYHVIVRKYEVCNLSNRTCQKLVQLFDWGHKVYLRLFLFLSKFSSHWVEFDFRQSPLPLIFGNWCIVQSNSYCAAVVRDVLVLVRLTLNPGWVAGWFQLQFQEIINIIYKEASWIGNSVKACNSKFPKLKHVHQNITKLYFFANPIQYPCSNYTALLISVCTVALVHWVGTSRTQRRTCLEILLYGRTVGTVFLKVESYISLSPPYPNSQGQSVPTYTFADLHQTCRTYKCRDTDW